MILAKSILSVLNIKTINKMDIESIINDYGTEVSILLAGIILLSALICGFLIWKWNKDDKLLDHRGVIEMMPSLVSTLGVFFTFAGIAIGLYYFDSENLTTSIPQLLAGLKTAFFTSAASLSASSLSILRFPPQDGH